MAYEPDITDLLWARSVLKLVKDGGIIAYPNTTLQYRIFHSKQALVLMNPDVLGTDFNAQEVHRRTKVVFGKLDYTVESIGGGG